MNDGFKFGLIATAAVIGIIIAGATVSLVTLPVRAVTGVAERTFNPDNMIHNYEWFKRQYQDVQAIGVKIGAAEASIAVFEKSAGERSTWKFEDRQEWNRLNNVLLGLQGQRASMVAEYNAKTQMANRNLFRTGDLPAELQ
ncbi:hypothetical protein [Shinella zoogloeoides]|uniref:hypothetical protein n=1 Tax=Shinella zoogloeoides TaxID=352475 RepID=UPI00273E7A36|nr:hypothetical protein [Shinella zoogloeoides]WLR90925.1 hypothetical protein Q9316_00680 [Shinella zoogloeoides]